MKLLHVIFILFLILSTTFSYNIIGGGVCECNSCGDCTNALNDNTNCANEVKLTTNISTNGACINNPSGFSNKIFNCQGYTISGNSSGYGIYLSNKNNNVIKNCKISGFYYGFYLFSSINNSIYNNYLNNANNAHDDNSNFWNTTKNCSQPNIIGGPCIGGNFYSDYYGVDTDGDGIGNTQYTNYGVSDPLPLVAVYFTNKTPLNNYSMNETTSHFTIEAKSLLDNFDSCNVQINNQNKTGTKNGNTCSYFWSGLTSIQYKVFFNTTSTETRNAIFTFATAFLEYPACTNQQISSVYQITNISNNYIYALKPNAPSTYPNCAWDVGGWYVYWKGATLRTQIQKGVISGSKTSNTLITSPTWSMTYYAPGVFFKNKTMWMDNFVEGISGMYVKLTVRLTNSSNNSIQYDAVYGTSANITISFYDNKTMCINTNCLPALDTIYTFSLTTSIYYSTTSYSTYSNNFCHGANNSWFCDPKINTPLDPKYRFVPYIYYLHDINTSVSFNPQSNKKIFIGNFTYEKFAAKPFTNNTNVFVFIEKNSSGTMFKVDKIDFFITNPATTPPYPAYYLTSNAQIIKPTLVFFPNINSILKQDIILPYYYSSETYVSKAISNTPTFLVDEWGVCYFSPPYSPSNPNITQTLAAYQIPCEVILNYVNEFPILPYHQVCRADKNNTYIIDIRYSPQNNIIFERYIYDITNDYVLTNNSEYKENITYTNTTTRIEVYANGIKRCVFEPQKINIFFPMPLNETRMPENMTTVVNYIIGVPIVITTAALSTVHPFVFVFTVAFNDIFKILPTTMMFMLAVVIGIFAIIGNWHGERNLKTLIILILILAVYSLQTHSLSEYESPSLVQFSALYQNLVDIFSGISGESDLMAIITTVLPTFLLNLIIVLLGFPAVIIGLIFDALAIISPSLATALYPFEIAFIAGAYVWLILKAYEMGRNMFRSV